MSNQNTLMIASNSIKIVNTQLNETPEFFLRDGKKVERSWAYLYDSISTSVTAINLIIEALNAYINATSLKSSINSYLPRSGYVADYNSTSVLKRIDNNDIWIQKKSTQLLSLLRTEDIESGVASPSEAFAKQALKENRTLALQMINQVYLDNVGNAHIQIGILCLSSHINYIIGYPTLQTIALAALKDSNDDVKDYAVRCYEMWNHKDGLRILKTIHTDTVWLQNYIDSVIESLSENFPEVISA